MATGMTEWEEDHEKQERKRGRKGREERRKGEWGGREGNRRVMVKNK